MNNQPDTWNENGQIIVPALTDRVGPVVGLGVDLVACNRVERMLRNHRDRFLKKYFSASEVEYSLSKREQVQELAVRLAAKEAAFKAIGARRGMGIGWKDFEVVVDPDGVPYLELHGKAESRGQSTGIRQVFLSLTHESEWVAAVVVVTG